MGKFARSRAHGFYLVASVYLYRKFNVLVKQSLVWITPRTDKLIKYQLLDREYVSEAGQTNLQRFLRPVWDPLAKVSSNRKGQRNR